MARWAVFDVDGTLLPRMSMEMEFLRYLLGKRLLPPQNLVYYLARGLGAALAHGWEDAIKGNKAYLRGLAVSDIEEYADACFQKRIVSGIVDAGKNQVETMRRQKYGILIITGAPSFLARRLRAAFVPDHLICTQLEIVNGHYSGKIVGVHPFGRRKQTILGDIQKELDIDFSRSIVFANHHSDIHHMKLFGKAVAVNPTPKLRRLASRLGWETVVWT